MERKYSLEKPKQVQPDPERPAYLINFDIQLEEIEGNKQYSYYSVSIPCCHWAYDYIVSALISAKYPSDVMYAVMNNYHQETSLEVLINLLKTTQNFNKLRSAMNDWLNSRNQSIISAYNEMQEFRVLCKQIAAEVLGK